MKNWIIAVAVSVVSLNAQAAGPMATQLSWIGTLPLLHPGGAASGLSLVAGLPNLVQLKPGTLTTILSDGKPILVDLSAAGINALSAATGGSGVLAHGSSSTLPGLERLPLGGLAAQVIGALPVVAPTAVRTLTTSTLPNLLAPKK